MTASDTASIEEANRINEVVTHRTFPPGLRTTGIDVKFGEDHSGRPAVWILLPVEREYENPPGKWITEVRDFVNRLRDDLLNEDLEHWPYIDLKQLQS
jgi:hypothetical protein